MVKKDYFYAKLLSYLLIISMLIGGIPTFAKPLVASAENAVNVLYVDGVGSGEADGSSAEDALATLADAYAKIPNANVKTIIVICGEVRVRVGQNQIYAESSVPGLYGYQLPTHNGEVVITSVYGEEDFKETSGIDFENQLYFLGGFTTFENIRIIKAASRTVENEISNNSYYNSYAHRLCAMYHDVHFGTGITGKVADVFFVGSYSTVSATATDAVFTMDSGEVWSVFGGGFQNNASGGTQNVTLNINGGTITRVFGSGSPANTADSYHKNITINVNGGTINDLYGASSSAVVNGKVKIVLNDGKVTNLYGTSAGGPTINANHPNPGIHGGLEIEMGGTTVTSMQAKPNTKIKVAKAILHYNNAESATLHASVRNGFDTLKLTGSTVTVPSGMENLFDTVTNLELTDDSLLTLATTPALTNAEAKVAVSMTQADADTGWNLTNPVITAPQNTGDIFHVVSPLVVSLARNDAESRSTWTLKKETPNIGQEGTAGVVLDIDLGLPEDDSFTTLSADATPYEVYQQKREDLGEAKDGVKVIQPFEVKGAVEIYVSPEGDDSNIGSEEAPLKTIAKALEYVAAFQESGGVEGIVVYLREGIYMISESMALNAAHSGKNGIPVFISAYGDEEVTITGGTNIAGSAFQTVTEVVDESVYNRLQENVRDNIVAVDLSEYGITELPSVITSSPKYQVLVNGEALTLARYPNAKRLTLTGKVIDIGKITVDYSDLGPKGTNSESTGIEYEMTDLRPTGWYCDGKIWVHGSFYAEWAVNKLRVTDIKKETGSIKTAGHTGLGAKSSSSNTYYYFNVLEELDVPGEYYLDTDTGILYLYPICSMEDAVVTYAAMQDSLISLTETENIILNGLKIENSASYGVYMQDCEQTVIQNCVISNVLKGARIHGRKSGVIYSDIEHIANEPVQISEAHTLFDYTPELNFLQNCYIHTTGTTNGKLSEITLQGTRNVVSHNLIQGTYAASIYLTNAKECIVEFNEIVGGPTGLFDMGAIYQPYQGPSDNGNHIRFNYIHDIGVGSNEYNPHAIYFDEGLSGNYAYGNIMKNVPCGFFTNSGIENVIINNVVLDGRDGTENGIFGSSNFGNYTIEQRFTRHKTLEDAYEKYWALSEAERGSLKQRYPLQVALYEKIKTAIDEDGDMSRKGLFIPSGNYAAENLLYDCGNISFAGEGNTIKDNTIATEDPFINVTDHNYSLKEGFSTDFTYIIPSMDQIGIIGEKQGIDAVTQYLPQDDALKADPTQILFQWTVGDGADYYVLKIATNEALTENVKELSTGEESIWVENDEYFTFDTTYYWTVTAMSMAESRNVTEVGSGTVSSFRTMTKNEYIEMNSADVSSLQATVEEAEALVAEITSVGEGDVWPEGTVAGLQQAIDKAGEVVAAAATKTQAEVDRENNDLIHAIWTAEVSRKVQYITFDGLDVEDWLDQGRSAVATTTQDGLTWTLSSGDTQIMYKQGVGIRDLLKFRFKIDTLKEWNGFAIAQSNIDKFITNAAATDGYLIVLKKDQLELQKRKGGKSYGNLAVATNNNVILTGGVWYDIELGAINHEDGSVQIVFKVNGNTVFDYLDKENAIAGKNGFGIVLQKESLNGSIHLNVADIREEIEIEVDNLATESGTVVTVPNGGWKEGSNTFTVSGENACVVVVSHDGGNNYERLSATKVAEGQYSYSVNNMTADSSIIVVTKGDLTGDGNVSTMDSMNIRAAALGKVTLEGINALAADVNGDGKINIIDSINVKAAVLGTDLAW